MVLRIPETGLQLESSAKAADTLPLQAFAITLSDNVIEDLIQCVQNGDDIRLSLGNVPSFLYGQEVHRISKTSETTDLDLYLTDPSDSTEYAERLPHPTMSLFIKPQLNRHPKLAQGREVARGKPASKSSAAGRKAQSDVPDEFEDLRREMAKANKEKQEHSTKIVDASISSTGAKRPVSKMNNKKLMPSKGGAMAGAMSGNIGRSAPASPALSGIISPSLGPTLSGAEQAKDEARELRAPIVHQLAVKAMSFEELRSRWPGDDADFKPALDKAAEFDNVRQKFNLKKMYWKELDVFKYDYDTDEERQMAIDNAIRMYDRIRMSASEPVWDKLLPKEERGKGKCLSKLLPTIANQTAAKTPQIKVNDGDESSGSKNGDGSQSGAETKKVAKKASQPMSRQSSQTKKPAKKIERKWVGKKETTPKVSPTKAGGKSAKDKSGRVLSKEFISDSDSSSEEAPLAKTVHRAKDKENEKEKERERQKEREKEQKERERERDREREKERERERQKEKEKEAAAAAASAPKPKPKPAAPKEVIKSQVIARAPAPKRNREEVEDDSSSSSSAPLNKRINKEPKAAVPSHSSVSHKRPPSDTSSQSSSRSNSNSYAGAGYTSKNKNTSPVKSSPLASSPPTNASDLDQQPIHETRHERERDRSRDRSVTVANGTINVAKKRKLESDGDVINVSAAAAEKKRQRLSTDILNDARTFKKCYEVYQRLHYELSGGRFSEETYHEKYETLLRQRKRLESLKASIYSQIPRECY